MSSSSSSPPPGPPPSGVPPPPPPSGGPPPPPPSTTTSSSPSITSANYFFGFVITFVVLLLIFIGCGLGSWRRLRLIGTAWDAQLQDMEGNPFTARKRGRRRLVRPTFQETWTCPPSSSMTAGHFALASGKSGRHWKGVQPVSAALVWSRSALIGCPNRSKSDTNPPEASRISPRVQNEGGSVARGVGAALRSYVCPQRPEHPSRPPPVRRPPPEAVQVAVMIAMPFQPSTMTSRQTADRQNFVGQLEVGEYQIGVVRIPWSSGEGP